MPEFQLDHGTQQSAAAFAALDAFTQGYLEAAFFTECHADNPELDGASIADLAPDALAAAIADCAAFQAQAAELLQAAYERDYSDEQAGRDFWFTRNGHGVGFWDREALEPDSEEYERLTSIMVAAGANSDAWDSAMTKRKALSAESIGARLSELCGFRSAFPEVDMYRGDDSQIYFS